MFESLGSLRSAEAQLWQTLIFLVLCVQAEPVGSHLSWVQFVGCTDGSLTFLMSCPSSAGSGGAQQVHDLQLQGFSESPKCSFVQPGTARCISYPWCFVLSQGCSEPPWNLAWPWEEEQHLLSEDTQIVAGAIIN